jgi:hypothetical protein
MQVFKRINTNQSHSLSMDISNKSEIDVAFKLLEVLKLCPRWVVNKMVKKRTYTLNLFDLNKIILTKHLLSITNYNCFKKQSGLS